MFLHLARLQRRQFQQARDEIRHARVDLGEQVALCWIERVVEVEHPIHHMAEIAERCEVYTRLWRGH